MKISMMFLLACVLIAAVGCYPVGHRYHDQESHQRQIEQMNNPDPPDF